MGDDDIKHVQNIAIEIADAELIKWKLDACLEDWHYVTTLFEEIVFYTLSPSDSLLSTQNSGG